MRVKQPAFIMVPLVIGSIAAVFGVVGHLVGVALGVPGRLGMPPALRCAGAVVLALGFLLLGWVYRHRRPAEVLASTYATMRKAVGRARPGGAPAPAGPLVMQGPQRHVRHPMYLAVVVLWIGWWLALDRTILLFMAILFLLWFNLVVIPFEERDLRAVFGEEYDAYAKAVPRFFPSLRRGRR